MGVYLQNPIKDKNIQKGEGNSMAFVSAEMQGWRKSMQDAAIHQLDIGNGNALFAVFDGHGGFEVSQFVAKIFVNELTKLKSYQEKDYERALDQAFKNVDELIKSSQGQNELRIIKYKTSDVNNFQKEFIGGGVGCTANVILITKQNYYIANAGDSRSVLSRAGKAVAFSQDHKPESQIEQSRIKKAGGSVVMGRVNGGLNLTRSFGDFDYKQNDKLGYEQQMITCKPDVRRFERKPQDEFILLGCDGIWQRYVDNNQGIIDIVHQHVARQPNRVKIVEELMQTLIAPDTNEGIGCDNMSCILISLKH